MAEKTIEEMKSELEAYGCTFVSVFDPFSDDNDDPYIEFPDKLMIVWNYDNHCIRDAYNLMQERRELEALRAENKDLRAFVLDVEYTGARPHLTQGARSLVSKHNITADESDDDE